MYRCVRDVGERETRRGVVGRKRERKKERNIVCMREKDGGVCVCVCERQCVCLREIEREKYRRSVC